MTKPAQSVNMFSREKVRIEKQKKIRQHYNLTPASSEAEAGLLYFFFQSAFITWTYFPVITQGQIPVLAYFSVPVQCQIPVKLLEGSPKSSPQSWKKPFLQPYPIPPHSARENESN